MLDETRVNPPRGRRAPILWLTLLLGVAVLGIYANAFDSPFEFDDWHVIPQNPAVRGPSDIPRFFVDPTAFSILEGNRDYRPLFLTSMALSWWIGGGATWPFHATSAVLHLLNSLLLVALLRHTLVHHWPGSRGEPRSGEWEAWITGTSFFGGFLFALHPLATDSVIYISAQSVPLAAMFYLSAFLMFLKIRAGRAGLADGFSATAHPWSKARSRWVLACSMLCFLCALLCKPIAITLLANLLLWELLLGRDLTGRSDTDAAGGLPRWWRGLWSRLLWHVPFYIVTAIYLGARRQLFETPYRLDATPRPLIDHYLTQTKALVFYYLKLAAAPFRLNVDPEFPVSTTIWEPRVLMALAFFLLVGWLVWRLRHRRLMVFWILWFPTCLFITTFGVVLIQVVNEHRVYLSLAGFCALAATAAGWLWRSLPVQWSDLRIGRRSGTRALGMAGGAILIVLGAQTFSRTEVWSSDLTLWGDAARNGGTWRAHMNYALALEAEGRADEALAEFQEAVRLGPYAWAHLNLGLAYVNRDQIELGLRHLRTAVDLWPSLAEAHLYLGYGLGQAGDAAEAEREMLRALELRPNYLKGFEFLGRFYENEGRLDEAIANYESLHRVDPSLAWVPNRIRMLQERASSGSAGGTAVEASFARAFRLQKAGRREEAIEQYEALLKQAPQHRLGTFNLAYAYRDGSTSVEWERSAELFRRVLEIDPEYTEALHHLATVYWKLGDEARARATDAEYLQRGGHPDLEERSRRRIAPR